MPRFVILRHELPVDHGRESHYDLMLELDAVLGTWELPRVPTCGTRQVVSRLQDHRIEYLTLEGELTGGRGTVQRVLSGSFTIVDPTQVCERTEILSPFSHVHLQVATWDDAALRACEQFEKLEIHFAAETHNNPGASVDSSTTCLLVVRSLNVPT